MLRTLSLLIFPIFLSACKSDICGSELAAEAESLARSAALYKLKAPSSAYFGIVQARLDEDASDKTTCQYCVDVEVSALNGFDKRVQDEYYFTVEFENGSDNYTVYNFCI